MICCIYCFVTKTEVLIFSYLCSNDSDFFRENSLSRFTFLFTFSSTRCVLFTRGTVGKRSGYIVNDRGLRCFSVSRTRRT